MKKMMTVFLLSFMTTTYCFGADLLLIGGESRGSCSQPDSWLREAARLAAKEKLPGTDYIQVSEWQENAYESDVYGSCRGKYGWAQALFVKEAEADEDWFLTIGGSIANPRKDHNVPGNNELTDLQAWNRATEKAEERVLTFCEGVIGAPEILEQTKNIFPGRNWYDAFTVKAKFHCQHREAMSRGEYP